MEDKMQPSTDSELTDAVLARVAGADDPRFREIMSSLVRHLHSFVREVSLTPREWAHAIQFLTETGQRCDGRRQEFILLSDTLGVSMLVDWLSHRKTEGATESTVLGPFFLDGAPELPPEADIAPGTPGEPTFVSGRVLSPDGQPVAGAVIDVWQAGPNGLYDMQEADPKMNLRARFRTGADGRYAFRTVKPHSYPIPVDGPVGGLLTHFGGHNQRPAHIHFMLAADGYEPVVTQLFVAGDGFIDKDAVFGVKDSLVVPFERHDSADEAAARGVAAPYFTVQHDFVLQPLRRAEAA
jgi:hydroxyquinol 1,2-dioxygenase